MDAIDPKNTTLPPIAAGTILWVDDAEIARSKFGEAIDHTGGGIALPLEPSSREHAEGARGSGFVVYNDGQLWGSVAETNYVGVDVISSDAQKSHCYCINNRDAGTLIRAGAGLFRSLLNHDYGARIATCNLGGSGHRAVLDIFADALIGYYGGCDGPGSGQSVLVNCVFQHNLIRDVVFRAFGCQLIGCTVNVALASKQRPIFDVAGFPMLGGRVGVQLDGPEGEILGGSVELFDEIHSGNTPNGDPASCVFVSGDNCKIETKLVDGDKLEGSRGIVAALPIGDAKTHCIQGLRIDCGFRGFAGKADRLFDILPGVTINGLDAKFSGDLSGKPIGDWLPNQRQYSGRIELFDTKSGRPFTVWGTKD